MKFFCKVVTVLAVFMLFFAITSCKNSTSADDGMTMIIVSHEMNFVKNCANKILFLDEGKVALFGTVNEVFSKENERLKEFLNL